MLYATSSRVQTKDQSVVLISTTVIGKMKYPAIVYALDDIENTFANDGVYLSARKYSVTVIDSDPDSSLVGKVASMPASRFNRHYTKDNLNHDVFEIFF